MGEESRANKTGRPFNPWLGMWVRPRETIRSIVNTNPKLHFPLLSAIYGFPMMLHFAQSLSLGQSMHWLAIVCVAAVLCTFVGMLGIVITTTLLHWTGRWIGGKSSFMEMRAAVSWASVTNIVSVVVWLILAGVFRQSAFMENFSTMPFAGGQQLLIFILFLAQTIVSIWSIVIFVKAIGEVQGFSAWMGLVNLIMPVIIVILIAWAIGLLVGCGMQPPPHA